MTELDLRVAHLPASAVEYLREVMPIASTDSSGVTDYDYEAWLDKVFE